MEVRVICSKYPQIEGETVVEGEIESGEAKKWELRKCRVDIYCITRSIMILCSKYYYDNQFKRMG